VFACIEVGDGKQFISLITFPLM